MLACGDGGKTNPRASLAVLHCALVQSSWIVLYLHRPRVTHGDSVGVGGYKVPGECLMIEI
jgi:hypothetical protein